MSSELENVVALVQRIRHDANNPLTAALGHVQLLLEEPAVVANEEFRTSLLTVEQELRRLTQILRKLGEVSAAPRQDAKTREDTAV